MNVIGLEIFTIKNAYIQSLNNWGCLVFIASPWQWEMNNMNV